MVLRASKQLYTLLHLKFMPSFSDRKKAESVQFSLFLKDQFIRSHLRVVFSQFNPVSLTKSKKKKGPFNIKKPNRLYQTVPSGKNKKLFETLGSTNKPAV